MAISANTALPAGSTARVHAKLNVRSQPRTAAARIGRLEPGTRVPVDALLPGERFLDSDLWYRAAGGGKYFWAGGASLEQPPPAPGPRLSVRTRPDGTIKPLPQQELEKLFGDLAPADSTPRGAVRITTPGWEAGHLVRFAHPVLDRLGHHPWVNQAMEPYLRKALDDVRGAGLDALILTFDGCFVPRYKNWNPATGQLSSHSWGIAIDINARFNGAGREPALPGQAGCLRELVPIFNAHGFAWGGHFSSNVDGMHFELALRQP